MVTISSSSPWRRPVRSGGPPGVPARPPSETEEPLGRGTRVEVTKTDLGPGVDVLVGNKFQGLDKKAPKQIRLPKPVETCVEVS